MLANSFHDIQSRSLPTTFRLLISSQFFTFSLDLFTTDQFPKGLTILSRRFLLDIQRNRSLLLTSFDQQTLSCAAIDDSRRIYLKLTYGKHHSTGPRKAFKRRQPPLELGNLISRILVAEEGLFEKPGR